MRRQEMAGANDRSGTTAIEFALVAPVFAGLLIGILEFGMYFLKLSHLKHVLYEASRDLQTGEIQSEDDPAAAFAEAACGTSSVIVKCSALFFDVRNFASLDAVDFPAAQYDEQGRPTNFVFEPGGPDRITAIRIASPHTLYTPFMEKLLGTGDAPAILVGYSVARNEPF